MFVCLFNSCNTQQFFTLPPKPPLLSLHPLQKQLKHALKFDRKRQFQAKKKRNSKKSLWLLLCPDSVFQPVRDETHTSPATVRVKIFMQMLQRPSSGAVSVASQTFQNVEFSSQDKWFGIFGGLTNRSKCRNFPAKTNGLVFSRNYAYN